LVEDSNYQGLLPTRDENAGAPEDMNNSIDRNSFQELLESTFALQQSGIAHRALSAIMDVQRCMRSEALTRANRMRFVVDRVRTIADADGAAIAFVRANQLVYEAGTGTATGCERVCLGAVLSASKKEGQRNEILRVENVENDSRIEGDICRQFGSKSLLLLPIYQDQVVAGVLEIRFGQAHVFQTEELRAYRLTTRLMEEALSTAANGSREEVRPQPAHPVGTGGINLPTGGCRNLMLGSQKPDRLLTTRDVMREKADPPLWPGSVPMRKSWPKAHPSRLIGASALIAIVAALIAQGWIAYDLHRATALIGAKLNPYSGRQHVRSYSTSFPVTPSVTVFNKAGERSLGSTFKRVRVGKEEIDYIADDVTIRDFKDHGLALRRAGLSQEFNIGDDVTVRLP
jgi:putative methionine-R-sulfoxide reductase with GAF domain